MTLIESWWTELVPLNRWFYAAAAFFGVFFLWQLIGSIVGLGSHDDVDVDTQVDPSAAHHTPDDAQDTLQVFRLVSVRSIISFFTLFTWASALYMNCGSTSVRSMSYGLLWGLAGMIIVSWIVHAMRRMAETGTMKVASCVGAAGAIYLDVPANGTGEVRLLCDGVMTHFKARVAGGASMKAGAAVKVLRILGGDTLEVAADNGTQEVKKQ
jgi:hypothetical protein